MRELFGMPTGTLAAVLVVLVALSLGAVSALAVRNRVFFRLGVRNIPRRPGRTLLIVMGLMLGTAIISAALATGDTMSTTIRSTAISALGQTDEVVSTKGTEVDPTLDVEVGRGVGYFPERAFVLVRHALSGSRLVDGVAPAVVENVAVRDVSTRQNEPRVTLFGSDSRYLSEFGKMRGVDGRDVSLADLGRGELFLNVDGADELEARAGDTVRIFTGRRVSTARVREIVRYKGAATSGPAVLMPLRPAQELVGQAGRIKHILVSNRGGTISGASLTDDVVRLLGPSLAPLGLEANTSKQDALELADTNGKAFMSIFTTFGSFSIAAGILLIFLIFVMLAAERRGELGIARAVGTRRGHLVQMFLFEGYAYDLLAAAVGALIGIAVAYGMVLVMASAFASVADVEIAYSVSARSVAIAYGLGVLLTFVVVTVSAWRVSRMNIVTAIRNLPEPPVAKRRKRRWIPGIVGVALGGAIAFGGVNGKDAVVLGFGVLLVILSVVPLARLVGVGDRIARTAAGLALVVWFVLPVNEWLFGDLKMDFSIFVLSGLAIVVGATWALMYNADVVLGVLAWTLGRARGLAPVLKMAAAYPLRSRFRTGVTVAMFTLVVFTLVVGTTVSGAFNNAFNDLDVYGGGFQVRATASDAAPVKDMPAALARTGFRRQFLAVSSQSVRPADARQARKKAAFNGYVVRGLDRVFLTRATYRFAATANGYGSPREVWTALRDHTGLAVVDSSVVPRRENFGNGPLPDFHLRGFYLEDGTFAPVPVDIRDAQTGKSIRVTVIGVLADTLPRELYGIATSQRTMASLFGARAEPTVHLFALRPGADASAVAKRLERAFLPNGMEAEALKDTLADQVSAGQTFNRIVEGFMGLGLVVGVAALGVITARSVVERRQQIGVLRAIGFRRRMVQLSFLLESSFIALTSILVGTTLALAVSFNIIRDSQSQPSWENLSFDVPWLSLGVIFLIVYVVALATTFLPAVRASRVYPAEALRYQ
jgi:putative ABC transport system permease protein